MNILPYMVYVEDDEEDREIFLEVTSSVGNMPVRFFDSGKELLAFLKGETELPCLVILDVQNPVISGLETYNLLHADEHFKELPVIFFSSSVNIPDKDKYRSDHTQFIEKPSDYKEWISLSVKLKEYCEKVVKY